MFTSHFAPKNRHLGCQQSARLQHPFIQHAAAPSYNANSCNQARGHYSIYIHYYKHTGIYLAFKHIPTLPYS